MMVSFIFSKSIRVDSGGCYILIVNYNHKFPHFWYFAVSITTSTVDGWIQTDKESLKHTPITGMYCQM